MRAVKARIPQRGNAQQGDKRAKVSDDTAILRRLSRLQLGDRFKFGLDSIR